MELSFYVSSLHALKLLLRETEFLQELGKESYQKGILTKEEQGEHPMGYHISTDIDEVLADKLQPSLNCNEMYAKIFSCKKKSLC